MEWLSSQLWNGKAGQKRFVKSKQQHLVITGLLASTVLSWLPANGETYDATRENKGASTLEIPQIVIVLGAGGTEEYAQEFKKAGEVWREIFENSVVAFIDGTESNEVDPPSVALDDTDSTESLSSESRQPNRERKSDRDKLLDYLQRMTQVGDTTSKSTGDSDNASSNETNKTTSVRWLVMIGHGTSDRSGSRFNLRGPDIEAKEISKAIENSHDRWVIINAFSSSSPFLDALSAPNRIVISATKSGSEHNYSRFASYLAQSLLEPETDLNFDTSISVLEAFLVASSRVSRFYSDEKRLATEQALLDDNGDRRGTPASFYRGLKPVKAPSEGLAMDGELASRISIRNLQEQDNISSETLVTIASIEDSIAELKAKKNSMELNEYQTELEVMLLKLAEVLNISSR